MIKMSFPDAAKEGLAILCLGAHSDDIEIGCGGTILRLLEEYRNVSVHWVVFGADGARADGGAGKRRLIPGEDKS